MRSDIPLPFRLGLPDDDSIGLSGIRSVSYELDGLLHLDEDALVFEWVARRETETVGFTGVKKEVDESPVGGREVPYDMLTRVRLRGWWWAPRLDLYARQLDAFDGIPGARGSVLTLKISRHDRALAAAVVQAIEGVRRALPPGADRWRRIGGSDPRRIGDGAT